MGYDDTRDVLITYDSYYSPPDYPLNFEVSYKEVEQEWRHLMITFILVYPPSEEPNVYRLLGPYGDPLWAVQEAYAHTRDGVLSDEGVDLFLMRIILVLINYYWGLHSGCPGL